MWQNDENWTQADPSDNRTWFDPRYAGVMFAIHAVSLCHECMEPGQFAYDRKAAFITKSLSAVFAAQPDCIAFVNGTGNVNGIWPYDWTMFQKIGCHWIRANIAACSIQQAWRTHHLKYRAARLIQTRWRFVSAWPMHDVCKSCIRHLCDDVNNYVRS